MNARSRTRASVHPRLRTRLRELTADAILEAAEHVFAETGNVAGMDAIAERAGVAVGTLYNHFRDRESLIDALFEARASAMLERVRREITETETLSFRPRLTRVLEAVLATASSNPRFRQVLLQAERRRARKSAITERLRRALEPLFEHGQREGALRADPYGIQPAFLLGQLHTAFSFATEEPERLPRERVVPLVVEQFLDGAMSPADIAPPRRAGAMPAKDRS